MEHCLLNYFILNDELRDTCDFNSAILTEGPGIYEVIRIIEGKPIFLDEHLDRFFNSAMHENFTMDYQIHDLRKRIQLLIEQNKMTFGNIRFQFIVHPHLGDLFIAWAISFFYPSQKEIKEGVTINTVKATRENPHSKRTNLPVRTLAESLIEKQHIAEVLMINTNGLITEGSRSNIFFVKDKKLYTPHSKLVLKGVTRDKIIELAIQNGIPTVEEKIRIDQIDQFEACFLSSTSKNVLPVKQIDEIQFQVNNRIVSEIMQLYNNLVKQYLNHFSW
jgi:branched-chain amino acid aminotransferase